MRTARNIPNIIGKTFGYLTVKEHNRELSKLKNKTYYTCLCHCGKVKDIRKDLLIRNFVKSCGCMQFIRVFCCKSCGVSFSKENKAKESNRCVFCESIAKHLRCMKNRCYNSKAARYIHYGAKGIAICDSWMKNTEAFIQWSLNSNYAEGLTIDRINNSLGYFPENCRWVTKLEQAQNMTTNVLNLELAKKIKEQYKIDKTVSKTAKSLNITYSRVYGVIVRGYWSNT